MIVFLSPRLIRQILPVLCLLMAGCSQEIIGPSDDPDTGEGKVVLTFNATTSLTTRTQLSGSQDLQHVREVQLYIFKGTGSDAVCVASEDVGWREKAGADGLPTTEQKYPVRYAGFEADTDYTFLAVGMDDASKDTYGLPDAIKVNDTTLQGANAVLATGKTKADIAISELFAGSLVLTYTNRSSIMGEIDLYRRVAGVMGYFKNAPSGTSRVRLSLYTQQNAKGYLRKQEAGNNYPVGLKNPENFKDFIKSPISADEADKVLVSIDVPAGTDATTTLSGGSYVLPAAAPDITDGSGEYTLLVELIGADGTSVTKTRRVRMAEGDDLYIDPTGGGTGIIDTSGPYRYPIVANRFYSVGTADAPIDLGEGGDEIVITVNPGWDGIVNVPINPN